MTVHSNSSLASCCNSVSCWGRLCLLVALHRTRPTYMARWRAAKEDLRELSISSAENSAEFVLFEPPLKTSSLSIPLRQQVTGIRVLAPEPGDVIVDDLCFTRFLKLVQEAVCLHGTPGSFPNAASWNDPQVLLAGVTAKKSAALGQVLHCRSRLLEHHESS